MGRSRVSAGAAAAAAARLTPARAASCELAARLGPYESYPGSPSSRGILQYDMWGVTPSDRWDWAGLKRDIAAHGLRNSLLIAPMPTASTAQILGNNEGFEPYTTNVYNRRVLAGEFTIVNTHMLKDLIELGLWTQSVRNQLIAEGGSIQGIACIPDELKALYKTVSACMCLCVCVCVCVCVCAGVVTRARRRRRRRAARRCGRSSRR